MPELLPKDVSIETRRITVSRAGVELPDARSVVAQGPDLLRSTARTATAAEYETRTAEHA
ncbi:MAG TPA: hypothetical protein VN969_25280 [Streptosporangiaceae bacterium]|nr:hypothetical protein [Streptosporangiaceae bacterium]